MLMETISIKLFYLKFWSKQDYRTKQYYNAEMNHQNLFPVSFDIAMKQKTSSFNNDSDWSNHQNSKTISCRLD